MEIPKKKKKKNIIKLDPYDESCSSPSPSPDR